IFESPIPTPFGGQVSQNAGDYAFDVVAWQGVESSSPTVRGVFKMSRVLRTLISGIFAFSIALPPVQGQQAQAPQSDPAPPQKLTKDQKKKMGKALKELGKEYKEWLNEDVVYIISPEERTAFLQLSTNEEREQFIEQFWLRRSSNPDLPDNDFKEEH